jgi:HlyD family secretion protein
MQVKQNKLFTTEAIERLSSPERLDQMMQVVSPRSWLPLTAIGCLVAAAGVWSAIGRIPLTVSGQGVLLLPRRVVQFQAANSGQLVKLNIKPGDVVKRGQEIGKVDKLDLKQQLGQEKAKLAELQGQKQDTNKLQKQQIALELKTLEQQQKDLQESLNRESVAPLLHQQTLAALEQKRQSLEESLPREQIAPILRQQTLAALAEKRQNLEASLRREQVAPVLRLQTLATIAKKRDSLLQRKQHINSLVETLQQRFETRRVLYEQERAISQDLWLQARQEFVDSQMQLADIETQLKELDVQKTNLVYLADRDGKQIKPGMTVQVTPSVVKRERYGGIVGKVTQVSPFPVTNQDMSAIIGNENLADSIAKSIAGGGAPVQVFVELQEDPNTVSGYKWSSSNGPPLKISPGTTALVRVQIGQLAPISYVIPIFRSLTGVY